MLVVYDIETVGDAMSVGCIWTCETDRYEFFRGQRAGAMVQRINAASLACGFHVSGFDNPILERMSRRRVTSCVYDLYAEIVRSIGYRQRGWTLEAIAAAMLPAHEHKAGDSSLMPAKFKGGAFDEVCGHALGDVRTTIAVLREVIRRGGVVSNGAAQTRVNVSRIGALQGNIYAGGHHRGNEGSLGRERQGDPVHPTGCADPP